MNSNQPSWSESIIASIDFDQYERLLSALRIPGRPQEVDLPDDFFRYFRHLREDRDMLGFLEETHILSTYFGSTVDRVLDLACGYGLQALCLRLLGVPHVVGLDYGDMKIETARMIVDYCQIPDIAFVQGSAFELPFESNTFDGALLSSAISHFSDLRGALEETFRVLKLGGVLVIHDDTNALHLPTRRKMKEIWHMSEYGDPDEIAGLGLTQNFYTLRQFIISEVAPHLTPAQINRIAHRSRGWTADDLRNYLRAEQGANSCPMRSRFYCVDPVTGVPQEELLNPFGVLRLLKNVGFEARLCPPPSWRLGGRTALGKMRKKLRSVFWPIQIIWYPHYYIRAVKSSMAMTS